MKIELYIQEQPADLDGNTHLPLTFQFEELSNPTVIKNSFSKTVKLPATDRNNQLFDHIWKPDHRIHRFNPSRRVPFVLVWNSTVIESGYIKLNSIEYTGSSPRTYNITLYGGLGSFFYELSEKKLKELQVDETKYTHTINRQTVINSWKNDYYRYMLSYSGGYDNFESDQMFKLIPSRHAYSVAFGNNTFVSTGPQFFAPSEDGKYYNEEQYTPGTYQRICYLRNKFYAVGNQGSLATSSDGKNWEYQQLNDGKIYDITYEPTQQKWVAIYENGEAAVSGNGTDWSYHRVTTSGQLRSVACGNGRFIAVAADGNLYACPYNSNTWSKLTFSTDILYRIIRANNCFVAVGGNKVHVSSDGIEWTTYEVEEERLVDITYGNGTFVAITDNGRFVISEDSKKWEEILPGGGYVRFTGITFGKGLFSCVTSNINLYSTDGRNWTYVNGYFTETEAGDEHQRNEFRSYYQRPLLRLKYLLQQIFEDSSYTIKVDETFFSKDNPYWEKTWLALDRLSLPERNPEEEIQQESHIRTGDTISFANLVTSDISQADFLLNLAKLFGLLFEKDKLSNTIYIRSRTTFFNDHKILDWEPKLDHNKSISIEPLTFNYRYWTFAWKDNQSHHEKEYQKKYGHAFGSKEIDTGYAFDDKENKLLPDNPFINAVVSQEYDYAFAGRNDTYPYRDDKILPALFTKKDNERNYLDSSLALFFDEGMKNSLLPFQISDDAPQMKESGIYCWTDIYTTNSTVYPLLTRITSDYKHSLDLAKPHEYYYEVDDEKYLSSSTLYARFWDPYIRERLSPENKKMTAWFHLTPVDINNFRFNQFIRIGNTLWFVNKIADFDITQEGSTKLELIRVNNINGYIQGQ